MRGDRDLLGIAASGKPVQMMGITMGRFANEKLMEGWTEFDQAGMLVQIGVLPVPE